MKDITLCPDDSSSDLTATHPLCSAHSLSLVSSYPSRILDDFLHSSSSTVGCGYRWGTSDPYNPGAGTLSYVSRQRKRQQQDLAA